MSTPDPGSLRAGNADRERVVARLNDAFAEGRLDVAELEERVAKAYAAKTVGELLPLTADLPVPRGAAPVALPAPGPAPEHRSGSSGRWAPAGGLLGILLVNVLIWAVASVASGHALYFWPVWIGIPLVFAVVGAARGGSDADGLTDRRRERLERRQQRRRLR